MKKCNFQNTKAEIFKCFFAVYQFHKERVIMAILSAIHIPMTPKKGASIKLNMTVIKTEIVKVNAVLRSYEVCVSSAPTGPNKHVNALPKANTTKAV